MFNKTIGSIIWLALFASLIMLGGCVQDKEASIDYPEPTAKELQAAFDRAITTLNEVTGSQIEAFGVDWVEVPNNCRQHLDYFAQQVLWARIYQPITKSTHTLHVDCSIAERYKHDALGHR
tara:strand:+ start:940 stop:1302 length:363 start_codon:yes stop_codon:yes gene_type:complete